MNPLDAVCTLILGFWKQRTAAKWMRAWMSLILSFVLTFLSVWGTTIAALYQPMGAVGALTLGFSAALLAGAAAILVIVRKVPQFKDVALFFPAGIEKAIADLEKQVVEFDPNKQKQNDLPAPS